MKHCRSWGYRLPSKERLGSGAYLAWSSLPVSVKELAKRQIQALYSEVQQENERQQSLTESGHKWNSLFLIVAFSAIFFS